ncbi:pantothenate kinase [Merismopedia glauca]|uniref:Type III pantothenate kinase n=1 Tax=Merismopedia glauca CCAP 1448/3 TaxID=1296344 RepID=A0A2T1C9W8_9CYAN|nr:pantothenate kinase [Merismopedia glauca]PSB05041.1 pantothenate kinase [Merismopedia glauca CCAP 1448/3]
MATDWLALCIGNSRYHWGWFQGNILIETQDTGHLGAEGQRGRGAEDGALKAAIPWKEIPDTTPIYLASVVPEQTNIWLNYPNLSQIKLEDIPIFGIYPTMGIDRALAIFGASKVYGAPVLVIDAGTALTFTGVNAELELVGGAILPGLNLQFECLSKNTAALPQGTIPTTLPPRWATDTSQAIQSGIIYTILAGIKDFIEDWQAEFESSKVVITGGNSSIIYQLYSQTSPIQTNLLTDSQLVFWGFKNLLIF